MEITEKVAYLKGLAEGMELDTDKKEGKLLAAIIDVLDDLALELADLRDLQMELEDGLDAVSEDLEDVEDIVYDCDDDFDDEDEDYEDDWDEDEEEPEEGFDFGDEDTTIYEVQCACGEVINFDEETLEKGSIVCPNCGETLEFSLEDEE